MADMTWLNEAANITLASKGSETPGIDGISRNTFEKKLQDELTAIRRQLLTGTYEPSPVRRVYIPKANGKKRPLGIPTLRDRVVQRAMLMVMEPIWESDFHDKSYGFRPTRSVHNAVGTLRMQLTDTRPKSQGTAGRWVIEGDLSSYFDTVHHKLLMKAVRKRVRDKRLLNLLWKFIKAGHVDKGIFRASSEGVPQGGVISPLLSNIMLNEFDQWLEENYLNPVTKRAVRVWNKSVRLQKPIAVREEREQKPYYSYSRYADDFVIVVHGTRGQAEDFREVCREFLEGKLRLKLNMEKTLITHVNDGFDFLGHRIVRKRGGRGNMRAVTIIPWKKYRSFVEGLLKLFKEERQEPYELLERLNHKLVGWSYFYKYTINTAKIYQRIDHMVFWKYAKWLAKKYRKSVKQMMRRWCDYVPEAKST
jgi:group II intron reverse transcriptase/maturase